MLPTDARTTKEDRPQIGQVVSLVKEYARQETIGPLKGAGRWLAFGTAAALSLGLGLSLVLLGVLRLIQTEWPETFDGGWSWVPYLIVLFLCLLITAFALSRVSKTTLGKESR